jgi:hypothetical protein
MDLKNIDEVKGLQSNLRACFDNPQGKEVMKFLEEACGWYESIFDPVNKDMILINAGKREVVATILTLLKCTPDQVVALAKAKENGTT